MTIKLSILQDSRQMVKKKWGSEMDLELAQTEDDIALNPDLFIPVFKVFSSPCGAWIIEQHYLEIG